MPGRQEMIDYIMEKINTASDLDLEQYYWFFMSESEG